MAKLLYNYLCPSVCPSVSPYVRFLLVAKLILITYVRPSVRMSSLGGNSIFNKNDKHSWKQSSRNQMVKRKIIYRVSFAAKFWFIMSFKSCKSVIGILNFLKSEYRDDWFIALSRNHHFMFHQSIGQFYHAKNNKRTSYCLRGVGPLKVQEDLINARLLQKLI